MFGGVISPKSRSSSISRRFQRTDPHPRERRSLVLHVHLLLSDRTNSKCFLCTWMELGWEVATSFGIVVFLADDSRRHGQLKMRCLSTRPSCSCLHGSVGAAPAEGGVRGCRGAIAAAGACPHPTQLQQECLLGFSLGELSAVHRGNRRRKRKMLRDLQAAASFQTSPTDWYLFVPPWPSKRYFCNTAGLNPSRCWDIAAFLMALMPPLQ